MVEESIASAPSTVYLAGRGDKGFYFGDGTVRYCSFGEAPQIVDPSTLEVRNVTKADEANYARTVMHWISLICAGMPGWPRMYPAAFIRCILWMHI
ncbi:MAG: hypothetical protein U0M15_09840 [Bacillota bacterium]|nr:hypothetical protein [Bacillota bacterium]